MHRWATLRTSRIVSVVVMVVASIMPFVPSLATASQLTESMVRLDRMTTSQTTGGTICGKPATALSSGSLIVITFPSTYTVDATASNWPTAGNTSVIDPANGTTAATAWPITNSVASAANNGTKKVTFVSGAVNAGTFYCFDFGDGTHFPLTTPGTAAASQQGVMETQTSGGTPIDTTRIAFATINSDQVVITAVVPPIFTMALQAAGGSPGTYTGTDSFTADLDPTATQHTTGVEFVIGTNAKGGWVSWVKDSGPAGLKSALASHTISPVAANAAAQSLANGTEGYGLNASVTSQPTQGTCSTINITGPYNGTVSSTVATAGNVGTSFQQLAGCTTGTSAGGTVKVQAQAAIATSTAAASDYTDTLTIVAAGNF
jgi:hypothetical protein